MFFSAAHTIVLQLAALSGEHYLQSEDMQSEDFHLRQSSMAAFSLQDSQ
jgi:hypothetical protein